MNVTGQTHIGLVRNNNQDALGYGSLGDGAHYAVVCDGMGGANGGNIASTIAAEVIAGRIQEGYRPGMSPSSVEHMLSSAMAAANALVFDRAQEDPELSGMGTTVVAVVTDGSVAYISHVGDSRLYHLRGDRLEPVTRDHSVVQELIESGQITEEEARSHPRRHFITRALGVKDSESGEYDELDLEPGDRLLLCTDGLTNMVEPDAICAHMHVDFAEEAVSALIQAALDGGGTDNITAVLLTVD